MTATNIKLALMCLAASYVCVSAAPPQRRHAPCHEPQSGAATTAASVPVVAPSSSAPVSSAPVGTPSAAAPTPTAPTPKAPTTKASTSTSKTTTSKAAPAPSSSVSAAAAAPSGSGVSPPAGGGPGAYQVDGVGTFNKMVSYDFTKLTALLAEIGISTGNIAAAGKLTQVRTVDQVKLNPSDSLSLFVQPYVAGSGEVKTSEIEIGSGNMLYGSIRVVAKTSPVPGTCHGFFFYKNDFQETDIEILTANRTGVWYTNQRATPSSPQSDINMAGASNPTEAYHEYRIDWLPDATTFYLDGVLQYKITQNVANQPSSYLINNWSNGDPNWSAGPPTALSDLRIQSIVGYFNSTT